MKKKYFVFLITILTSLTACNGNKTSKAKIFERKEVEENKLMIKYVFLVNGNRVTDSAIIDNTVLNSDSITITYNTSNPSENSLQIPD